MTDSERTKFTDALVFSQIPVHMREGMINYFIHRLEPGSFLFAMLSNDIELARVKADSINAFCIPEYEKFFVDHCDEEAYGSREKVQAWLKRGIRH
tara:strand:- start:225 stop:512 length:288 start_codon:yes stop_codon:yes gene_type:complete